MQKWWNWLLGLALFSLLFIAIPISLSKKVRSKEELKPVFDDYIEKFNKTYKSDPVEYAARFQHFVESVREIDALNAASRGPEQHRASYGLTKHSDMSKDEFKDIHLADEHFTKAPATYNRSWNNRDKDLNKYHVHNSHSHHENVDILVRKKRAAMPMKLDWRTSGVVSPVKNQGLCGACWAFATIGAMESMEAIKTGKLSPLSVQEVIDCAGLGNSGCAGGDICLLLDWLSLTSTPVQLEKEYPLKLKNDLCMTRKNATGVRLQRFTCDDFVTTEDKILEALAHGPVAVAVNALTWQNYLGGVIQYQCSGAPADLNHAVLLVGYDLTADVPHYIAKNSWGPEFGNAGYIKLAVGSNVCGLANEVATVDVL